MTAQDLTRAIKYGTHSSATKETNFVRTELEEQARAGHMTLFPLKTVHHLPRLWLSPLASILQRGRKPRLVYDFSWSGLNEVVTQVAHKEAMRFGKSLYRLIDCILAAPPQAMPRFTQKSRPIRYIHAHLGPPQGYPNGRIPCTKSNTRRRTTSRFPPINNHGVRGIRRLLLRND